MFLTGDLFLVDSVAQGGILVGWRPVKIKKTVYLGERMKSGTNIPF